MHPEATFAALSTEGALRLCFASRPGSPTVSPRILFFKPSEEVTPVEVLVDGRVHHLETVATRSGEFPLSPISPGDHRVEVRSPERMAFYANWVVATPETIVLGERTAYRVGEEGLIFRLRKAPRETIRISFRLYRPAASRDQVRVRAVVKGVEKPPNVPLGSWTFPSTLYILRPPGGYWLPLFGSAGELVAGGDEAFFLTLGPDVPDGEPEIRVYVEDGPCCFLTATQVVPESPELRRFFRDRDFVSAGQWGG
jgi:hypothetical protein